MGLLPEGSGLARVSRKTPWPSGLLAALLDAGAAAVLVRPRDRLAEDNDINARIVQVVLQVVLARAGHEVVWARDGKEALAAVDGQGRRGLGRVGQAGLDQARPGASGRLPPSTGA